MVTDPRNQLHLVIRMNVNLFYLIIPEIILLQNNANLYKSVTASSFSTYPLTTGTCAT